jgi:hypothetical protein
MCLIGEVYTPEELKTLSKQRRNILQKYGRLVVLTNPAILNIIKKDPKIRKELKRLLGPEYRRLKRI